MRRLLIGFDSAWTPNRKGALVGVVHDARAGFRSLGEPQTACFPAAAAQIAQWQHEVAPDLTLVLLDQPTIVRNATGQRPVENLVAGPVSRRRGGVQPSNTSRREMFGANAPLWPFLQRFGGAADPLATMARTCVFETYPVLALIALGWTRPDPRSAGRLPKYNPERRKTFSLDDWQFVARRVAAECRRRGLAGLERWLATQAGSPRPTKHDQDGLDACLCLLTAMHVSEGRECLVVGDTATGSILCPFGAALQRELDDRCTATGRKPADWVKVVQPSTDAS